jgi:hypothetical protein
MPIESTGVVSRNGLHNPEQPKKIEAPSFETVLKFNPNHGPDGRFASSGGGRRGGTAGPPTEDALGNPLVRRPGNVGGTRRKPSEPHKVGKVRPNAVNDPAGRFRQNPIDPAKANAYWDSLSPTQRKQLVTDLQAPKKFQVQNAMNLTAEQKAKNYETMFGKKPGSPKASKPAELTPERSLEDLYKDPTWGNYWKMDVPEELTPTGRQVRGGSMKPGPGTMSLRNENFVPQEDGTYQDRYGWTYKKKVYAKLPPAALRQRERLKFR